MGHSFAQAITFSDGIIRMLVEKHFPALVKILIEKMVSTQTHSLTPKSLV